MASTGNNSISSTDVNVNNCSGGDNNNSSNNSADEERMQAMLLGSACVLPMALKVAIDLKVLEIISRGGPGAQLSAAQIVSQLDASHNPDAVTMLDRVLKFLARYSILTCSVLTHGDGLDIELVYGLGRLSKYFTQNEDGFSVAPYLALVHDRVFINCWYHLEDSILQGGVPFEKANGMKPFEYLATDPRMNKIFNKAMHSLSTIVMGKILEIYEGFEGLKVLVDVGGGDGATLNMIITKYPHIKGLNYDLPHVIANAPTYHGVEHVRGDMFESVPNAEAIFMKWILHDWSDEHCLKLLKNCYKALPDSGKLIIVETLIPLVPDIDGSTASKCDFHFDILMLAYTDGGKERTQRQFEALVKEAGFARLDVVCCAYHFWVMKCDKKV